MNVIFHALTAIGIAVALTDTRKIAPDTSITRTIPTTLAALALGVISHGALDYIPHCYPINSKVDVIASLLMIMALTLLANKTYRLVIVLSSLGCILPDIIDLAPTIANKHFGLHLPFHNKLFPWHQPEFSGSIYNSRCNVSTLDHMFLIVAIAAICWFRQRDLKTIFKK